MRRENQKVILVTGKGGVGKTAVAASIALAQARQSKKVLLAELGERSFLRHVFPGVGGPRPKGVTDGLEVVRWDAEVCLREYLLHYLKVERVVDLFFNQRVTHALIDAAPALRELAILGKVTSGPRGVGPDLPYDVVVVDAYATGHFQALLMAPVGMAEAVRLGPMGEQSRQMVEIIKQTKNTTVVVVTLPEELPVNESAELGHFLKSRFGLEPWVIVNRNLPLPLSAEELEQVRGRVRALSRPPAWAPELMDYLEVQGRRQEEAHQRVREWATRFFELPWYFQSQWPDLLRVMSQDVGARWPNG